MFPRTALCCLLTTATFAECADPFQSQAAKKAQADFDASLRKLDEEYQKKIATIREDYVKALEEARADALTKKNLEEAQRIVVSQRDVASDPLARATFQLLFVYWGWHNKWVDATPTVKKLVHNGQLKVGGKDWPDLGDPAFGQYKSLVLVYRHNGLVRIAITGGDKVLTLPEQR